MARPASLRSSIKDKKYAKTHGEKRPLYTIAYEISKLWKKPYFGAVPYIDALKAVSGVNSEFGQEDGRTLVIYFLANASTWRGEDARRIKAELKALL